MTQKSATQIDKTIGLRMRNIRKKNRISQEELGKQIGVSFQQVQKYENGSNRLSAARLVHVARILGVSVMYFLDAPEPGFPAHTIQGIRVEFNAAVKHINAIGDSIGAAVRAELRT